MCPYFTRFHDRKYKDKNSPQYCVLGMLYSMCYKNFKENCFVFYLWSYSKNWSQKVMLERTIRRNKIKGKKSWQESGINLFLGVLHSFAERKFLVLFCFFSSFIQCTLIFAFCNLRIMMHVFFWFWGSWVFSFSLFFQKPVTIFYPNIHNTYIHRHTFICTLVQYKTTFVKGNLTVYQPGNAGFGCFFKLLLYMKKEYSSIQEKRVVINHLHWKDKYVWCLFLFQSEINSCDCRVNTSKTTEIKFLYKTITLERTKKWY